MSRSESAQTGLATCVRKAHSSFNNVVDDATIQLNSMSCHRGFAASLIAVRWVRFLCGRRLGPRTTARKFELRHRALFEVVVESFD